MTETHFPFTTDSLFTTALEEMKLAALHNLTDRCLRIQEQIQKHCNAERLNQMTALVAPTTFTEKHFDVRDDAGGCALIFPCYDEDGSLQDLVAFELGEPFRIRTYLGRAMCIGLPEIFEARHHPQYRVPISSGIWPFLKADCRGLLPINWRQTALHLHQRGVKGLIASTREDGEAVEAKLKQALPDIPLFVAMDEHAEVAA